MNRNDLLDSLVSSFMNYSANDSRKTVKKVLKYSGSPFNIRARGDIVSESVFFRLTGSSAMYNVEDEKPYEARQSIESLVFIDQPDSHSGKANAYSRLLEIADLLVDWSMDTSADSVSQDIYTLTFSGTSRIEEQDGYLSTTVNFQSIIKLQ